MDDLWPPRAIVNDGLPYPAEWKDFLGVAWRLLDEVAGHPSHGACKSMMARSFRKIATVHRMTGTRTYIQTGLAQRGLGLGWRHRDPEAVRPYYEAMPVSLGVAILKAPVDVLERRNVERGKDRSYMLADMVRPLEIAEEVLKARGVPVKVIDTTRTRQKCRARLVEFAESLGATV
ncbi:MAG: hypothetical protein ACLFPA_13210 [Dichotomicrobium sp.]